MDSIYLKVCQKNTTYDHLLINNLLITTFKENSDAFSGCGDCKSVNENQLHIHWDGIVTHYIVQELKICESYRKAFIKQIKSRSANGIVVQLKSTKKQIIDYQWNERTTYLAWERLELDHAQSWLSTLGGAFSALGDYFPNAAQMAGKISLHQFKLALRLDDPNIQSRCRLFMSLSLIQQGRLKLARNIIRTEYQISKNSIVVDVRLVKMCLGIWAKLKYEWYKKKNNIK